jgi:uncharacterized membrane protein
MTGSGWQLSPRARKCVLAVHVIASLALIGSSASTVGLALIAAGTEPASDAHALYTAARTLVYALAIPFMVVALVTGIVLGLGTRWGVLRHSWVVAKLGLLVAVILNGALVIHPLIGELIDATSARPAADAGTAEWAMPAAAALNIVFVTASATLAIFKPGGRLRARRADDEATRPRSGGSHGRSGRASHVPPSPIRGS